MNPYYFCNVPTTLSYVTGTVLDGKDYITSEVHSTHSPFAGRNAAPRIRTEKTQHHDLWLKLDDGREDKFKLQGGDIAYRPGSRLSIISLSAKKLPSPLQVAVFNHSMGKRFNLLDGSDLHTVFDAVKFRPLYRGLGWAAVFVACVFQPGLALLAIPGFLFTRLSKPGADAKRDAQYNQHLDAYMKEVDAEVRKVWSPKASQPEAA